MDIVQEVKKTLKWKMSATYCADRIGIPLEQYKQIRSNLRNIVEETQLDIDKQIKLEEDFVQGTATVQYSGPIEIKTQEDLVRECNIDLDKWTITKLIHNAWGKQGNQSYQVKAWLSSKVNSIPDLIEKTLSEFKFQYTPTAVKHLNTKFTTPTCAVLSLQDIHIGKEIVEKGGKDLIQSVRDCIENLIMRSYHSNNLEKIIFVLGGDLLHVDSFALTTTSGTPVESSLSAYDAYKIAFDLMFWAVSYMRQFCKELEVVYIPGNHDRLSSSHIAYSLSKVINSPDIKWNIDYAERKVIVYGNSMICLEHGDFNISRSFQVFATEFAKEWGDTTWRTCYTGHTHKEKKVEYITTNEECGFTLRTLPSLSKADRYHTENKWVQNKRGGIIELHSIDSGPTGNFSYFE